MARARANILIGEDDAIVALDMQQQLSGLACKVEIQAGSPGEVVSLASKLKPDLIILDLNIKGYMHGIQVAPEVNSTALMPIVFVSSYAKDVLDNTPASPGPYRYMTKPFNLPELEDAIESLLAEVGSPKVALRKSSDL